MIGWIKRVLNEDVKEDFGNPVKVEPYVSAFSADEPKKEEKRSRYPKSEEDLEASRQASQRWGEKADRALKNYKPKGPAFKIVQADEGHFEILRRMVRRAQHLSGGYSSYSLFSSEARWADEIDAQPFKPREFYEVVVNDKAPIQSVDYGGYGGEKSYRTIGYAPLAFNVFEGAEAYLKRMTATPAQREVGYDYPPLKRRQTVKPKEKV